MSSTEVATTDDGGDLSLTPVGRQFADMVATLPQDGGGGMESIVAQILAAESFDQLDAPWGGENAEEFIGRVITLRAVKARPSDYSQGLGFYVIATGNDYQSGDAVTLITGSVGIVAQLVKAHTLGAFPIVCAVVKAKRPTKDGYYPYHLAIVTPDRGAPA